MIVAAALCPHPPLLVPEVAAGAARELDDLRADCAAALDLVLRPGPDVVVVVGGGPVDSVHPGDAAGTTAPYGPHVRVGGAGEPVLPLAGTVGAWLLDRSGTSVPRRYVVVTDSTPPAACAERGREVAGWGARVALLVMGDGSPRRTTASPGSYDARARGYDDAAARAVGAGDRAALLALDPALGRELRVAGRAPWQVLAGAWGERPVTGAVLRAPSDDPYGVGYLVATWC